MQIVAATTYGRAVRKLLSTAERKDLAPADLKAWARLVEPVKRERRRSPRPPEARDRAPNARSRARSGPR